MFLFGTPGSRYWPSNHHGSVEKLHTLEDYFRKYKHFPSETAVLCRFRWEFCDKSGTSRFVPPLPIPTVAGWFTSQFTSLMAQTWACAHVGAMCGCNVGPVQSCTREKLQETLRSQRERNVTKVWQDLISHVTPYMVKHSISPKIGIYIFSIDLLSIKYLIPMMNVVFFFLSSLNCEHRTFHQATSSLPRCIAWTLHFFAGRWQPRINQNSSWKSWSWQAMKLRGAWNWQSQGINGYEWFIVI